VTVETPTGVEVQVLPIKHPQLGIIYPMGVYTGVFWWEELLIFIEMGGKILQTHKILYASLETCNCTSVAQQLLNLRLEGNLFAKLILNSIYGRFAFEPAPTRTRFYCASNMDLAKLN
jgi:hypothetical protein